MVEVFAVLLFTQRSLVEKQINREYAGTVQLMGKQNAARIYATANRWFIDTMVKSGAFDASYHMFVPQGERDMKGQHALSDGIGWFEQRLNAFWAVIFRSYQRWALFLAWLPYALLILVPSAIDGWVQRQIKKETFGYTSPLRYAVAFYTMVALLVSPILYFLLPVAITPLFAPIWAVVMIAVASVVGVLMAVTRRDAAYLFVLVWSFIGIAVKQADTSLVASSAWVGAGVMLAMVIYSLSRRRTA